MVMDSAAVARRAKFAGLLHTKTVGCFSGLAMMVFSMVPHLRTRAASSSQVAWVLNLSSVLRVNPSIATLHVAQAWIWSCCCCCRLALASSTFLPGLPGLHHSQQLLEALHLRGV
jgi:hypothetical protein